MAVTFAGEDRHTGEELSPADSPLWRSRLDSTPIDVERVADAVVAGLLASWPHGPAEPAPAGTHAGTGAAADRAAGRAVPRRLPPAGLVKHRVGLVCRGALEWLPSGTAPAVARGHADAPPTGGGVPVGALRPDGTVGEPPRTPYEAVAWVAAVLGVPARDVYLAAGIKARTYHSWNDPDAPAPRLASQGRLWELADVVHDLAVVLAPRPVARWFAADPQRRRTLGAGAFDALLTAAVTERAAAGAYRRPDAVAEAIAELRRAGAEDPGHDREPRETAVAPASGRSGVRPVGRRARTAPTRRDRGDADG